jgi:Uma2 family endonuclease
MPHDGHRYELIDGVLIVTPAPATRHQLVVSSLIVLLQEATGDDYYVLPGPYDYKVNDLTVLEPDLVVARKADFGEKRLDRTPTLVVEVQSPSTRKIDLGAKRLAFEAAGVPAYWLVDPAVPSLTVLRLDAGRYAEEAVVEGDGIYDGSSPFAVRVVPADLVR